MRIIFPDKSTQMLILQNIIRFESVYLILRNLLKIRMDSLRLLGRSSVLVFLRPADGLKNYRLVRLYYVRN